MTLSAVTQASRLVRRKAAPIALEQRFMFDGAAVVDATAVLASGDHEIATQDTTAPDVAPLADASINAGTPVAVASTTGEEALFALAAGDADAGNSKLEQGLAAAQQTLLSWAGSAEAVADVTGVFAPQDSSTGTADSRTLQALQDIRSGEATVSVELREHNELLGAFGAFASSGPAGAPVIYLNRDWVESQQTSVEAIQTVVLEEYGHYLDNLLNEGKDSLGDEGETFAHLVLQQQLSADDFSRMAVENDHVVIEMDGQPVELELASLLFSRMAYFAENAAALGTATADLEGNYLQLMGLVGADVGAVKYLYTSDPASDPIFSGNNVVGTLYAINSSNAVVTSFRGEISRLVKTGSRVEGLQFYQYDDGETTADGTPHTTIVIDLGVSGATTLFATDSVVRTSSDPVDDALNALLGGTQTAIDASNDTDTALESGGVNNTTVPVDAQANGNLLTNDSGGTANYSASGGTLVSSSAGDLSVTRVSSTLSGQSDQPATGSSTSTSYDASSNDYATVVGRYGSLIVGADGQYVYTVNNDHPDVQALRTTSDTLTETFSYEIVSSNGGVDVASLNISIGGHNDNPDANDDTDYAKESLLTDGTQYTGSDPVGIQATGNVLTNDSDIDQYGETHVITGLGATAQGNSPSDSILQLSSVSPSISAGDYVFLDNAGSRGTVLLDENGVAITVVSNGTSVQLSGQISNATLTGTETLGFSGSLTTGNYKTATITGISAVPTDLVDISGTSATSGTIAIGMSVSGAGLTAGTTVTDITYAVDGTVTQIRLSQTAVIANSPLTFSAAIGTTLTGRYGTLALSANGDYIYTPTDPDGLLANGADGVDTFRYTMQDLAGAQSQATLTILVSGSGDLDPTVSGTSTSATEHGGTANGEQVPDAQGTMDLGAEPTANTSGSNFVSRVISPADGSASTLASVTDVIYDGVTYHAQITGRYGALYVKSDGSYRYVVDNSLPAVETLKDGQTLTEVFGYAVENTVTTGIDWADLSITINGNYDAPVATDDVGQATEAALGTGNVLTNDTDVDASDTKTVTQAGSTEAGLAALSSGSADITGSYGTLTINADGSYTYAVDTADSTVRGLKAGERLTEDFFYRVTDGGTLSDTAKLTVEVIGANEAPVNSTPSGLSTDYGTALSIGALDVTDVDGNLSSVTLTATNGTLNLQSYSGPATVTVVDGAITIEGSQTDIRAALDTLRFTPEAGFSGTASVTITAYDNQNALDRDSFNITVRQQPVVSGDTYNEASPRAVFTVTVTAGQALVLDVRDVAASGNNATGTVDGSALTNQPIWTSLDGGATWQSYTAGATITATGSTVLVAVDITAESDSPYEGMEQLQLVVNDGTATSAAGHAGIIDNGTGLITGAIDTSTTNDAGANNASAVKDDDRALSVSDITVNEGSPYAVFTVSGAAGQLASLSLADGTATGLSGLQVYDGSAWVAYTSGTIALDSTGTLLVRTALSPEQEAAIDNGETFTLTATNTAGTNDVGTATVKDDGTGAIFKNDGTQDNTATKDDDRA
ncbi:VCBS domain-containing protein, partial [Hydrogenophaga sp.]|uniref:beta strand repeat-containing protein n=1 Tax=Hydrogenophaga sp. TaxID=1904254 RepID=UPI00286DCE47